KVVGQRVHEAIRDGLVVGIACRTTERKHGNMFFAAGVSQTGEAFAGGRKEQGSDGDEDDAERAESEPAGGAGFAGGPRRSGGVVHELLEFMGCDCVTSGWF